MMAASHCARTHADIAALLLTEKRKSCKEMTTKLFSVVSACRCSAVLSGLSIIYLLLEYRVRSNEGSPGDRSGPIS